LRLLVAACAGEAPQQRHQPDVAERTREFHPMAGFDVRPTPRVL
jgi:hypothetical protein